MEQETKDQIIALAKLGRNATFIALATGCTRQQVRHIVVKSGNTHNRSRRHIVANMWVNGFSNREISDVVGCGLETVGHIAHRIGFPPKRLFGEIPEETKEAILKLRREHRASIDGIKESFPYVGWGTIQRLLERNGLSRLKDF